MIGDPSQPVDTLTRWLQGKPVRESLLHQARSRLDNSAVGTARPLLASVHVGNGGPFAFYLKNQARTAQELGIGLRDVALPERAGIDDIHRKIEALEKDPDVHAVLVQHPLPEGMDFHAAVDRLSPAKDVDGVGAVNLGRLVAQHATHAPAVALAVLQILGHYSITTRGRRAVVIGRSSTVGLPLAVLLAGRGEFGDATVTIVHSRTPHLGRVLAGADLVVSCAGAPGLLNRAVVPQGAIVVDVGLSTVPDPSTASGTRISGDADAASLDGWVEALTPVPGGVGPVTVAQLMLNVVTAWKLQTGGQ